MSAYSAFDCLIDNDDGSITKLISQTIHVYDVTHTTALADLTSDVNGHVASGTLAVAAGTVVRFYFTRTDGVCGYTEQTTT
jgi:hypothetical protein